MQNHLVPSATPLPAAPSTPIVHAPPGDDLSVLRSRLQRVPAGRVILALPWDSRAVRRLLDYELLLRDAQRLGLDLAIVCPDPEQRSLARQAGLPAFAGIEAAEAALPWPRPKQRGIEPPPKHWWDEELPLWPPPAIRAIPRWLRHIWLGARLTIFVATLLVVGLSAVFILPSAEVTLIPAGQTIRVIVPVSIDPEAETVDTAARVAPTRRVGEYVEGYLEIETTGTAPFVSGRATGTVLFTNLLAQDVPVRPGTVVRTSAGSFPARFVTTQDAVVPALGQAPVSVEAVEDGPSGNVGVNQINRVEGISGLALRVTNPTPTTGGATQDARAVSQADMDRVRALLTEQLLDEAHRVLGGLLEPTEFIPRQSLVVQSTETSYNRFLTERADSVGLYMRILVTGQAIDRHNAETVAYAALLRNLPDGYELLGVGFEVGEIAEEPIGAGDMTLFVTATGSAAARIDPDEVRRAIQGRLPDEAMRNLTQLPLDAPPQITVLPEWFPRLPLLALRITVDIIPQR